MDTALISITRGEPTQDEVTALLVVLLACRSQPPVPAVTPASTWRAAGLRSRSFQGPAAWSPEPRRSSWRR
jgi:Acyl-CoA carboxylase epsilon subunit